ncbi:MAG: hypothetical protein ACPGVD_05830, partial [Flavobacteriales bacterium]
ALLAVSVLMSCGSDAVEATDAKKVEETAITATYSTLGDQNQVDWKAWHFGKTAERFGHVTIKSGEVITEKNQLVSGKFEIDIENLTVE